MTLARAIASWLSLVGAGVCLTAAISALAELQWVLAVVAVVLFIFGVEVSCER